MWLLDLALSLAGYAVGIFALVAMPFVATVLATPASRAQGSIMILLYLCLFLGLALVFGWPLRT